MSSDRSMLLHTFVRPRGFRFKISVPAWLIMQRFQQSEMHMAESGGVLLGRHLRDDSAIIVDNITTPLSGDRRDRARFFRAQRRHQAIIDEAWRTSSGTCTVSGRMAHTLSPSLSLQPLIGLTSNASGKRSVLRADILCHRRHQARICLGRSTRWAYRTVIIDPKIGAAWKSLANDQIFLSM